MAAERCLALVTGAGSGIGLATARVLADAGMTVAAADVDEGAVAEAAKTLEQVVPFTADVADDASVKALAADVRRGLGVPWVVVNCAGWDETQPFLDTEPSFWRRVVEVNLLGVVRVSHSFVAAMVQHGQGGRVVNVASDAGRVGSSGEAVYSGAKGGVIAFTKALARELARHAITANAVCPGPTDTPLFRRQPERLRAALQRAVPLGRLGQPKDVAHAIAYLASERAGYVTGQVLSVNGGLTMNG